MWVSFARLEQRYGTQAALEIAGASEDSVVQIGEFCEQQEVDAWFRYQGYLNVATTKAQRKLFFNLRSMKQSMKDDALDVDTHRNTLTQGEVDKLARTLNVKREEVLEMETRLSGGDVALEPQNDDGEESYAPIAYLADDSQEPTRVIEARGRDWLAGDGIAHALNALD